MSFHLASNLQTKETLWVANGKCYDTVSLAAYYRDKYKKPHKCPISGHKYE